MATPFKLRILSPDKIFYDGETERIITRTTVGEVGILANHEPYCAALTIGKLRVFVDGAYKNAAISSGVIRVVKGGETLILAQSIEWCEDIDVDRANRAKASASKRLADAGKDAHAADIAEFKLKRALNRLETAQL
ncbi:ATP synthase epsilon chain [Clostridia bacterium]|nr:ATP synthase epsilon chain [Clostridia bacterium]